MSGIKLLPPFVLLVAGFLLCHSIPSWRRYVIRANGQQLTLRSAIAGFGAALPVFAVLYLLHAFSAPSASPYANLDTQGAPSRHNDGPRRAHRCDAGLFARQPCFLATYSSRAFQPNVD